MINLDNLTKQQEDDIENLADILYTWMCNVDDSDADYDMILSNIKSDIQNNNGIVNMLNTTVTDCDVPVQINIDLNEMKLIYYVGPGAETEDEDALFKEESISHEELSGGFTDSDLLHDLIEEIEEEPEKYGLKDSLYGLILRDHNGYFKCVAPDARFSPEDEKAIMDILSKYTDVKSADDMNVQSAMHSILVAMLSKKAA